ncbi:MAG: hypothetical protein IJP26_03470 [Clostridia bacterium]|nr:hypothetical protein [Clostridia bacterium]
MADYKRKKVKKRKTTPKNVINKDVQMAPSKQSTPKKPKETPNKIRVIRGNRKKIIKKRWYLTLTTISLAIVIVLLSFLTPTGLFETVINITSSVKIGNGYEVNLSGGTISKVIPKNNHYFVLSSTDYKCFNNNGEDIFSYQHGFENPIVVNGNARSLLFDLSGTQFNIYNLNKKVYSGSTQKEILTADIARNGNFAVATLSDSYTSQVTVYNKKGTPIYEWFCSELIINNIALSPNGKKLAVSAISASGGKFISKLYILEFDSATPIAVFDYSELLLNIEKVGNSGFACIFEKSCEFYNWQRLKKSNYSSEEEILFSQSYNSSLMLITGRAGDKRLNYVKIFNTKGKITKEFVFDGVLDSVTFKGNYISFLSENYLFLYNLNGQLISKKPCEFGVSFAVPISRRQAALISDNNINKLTF